ncbi:cytochrome d ubiquinol oxidase subunit II [Actomonas aquatica]|uniref:Cytochrome d ubiquinol oxidase subunit II n=1 Tax=Actomonas aquatica TaxID=2866162 RepID=A0ABZ1C9D2_9BACT|nr:cytochrome d ubiquinol oxidase subunit II [Opitutus sp. WL0086]WRQ87907.1 cytochrome d ubiquinol oxidase subunit II [Opitutus sp. WL0086]
MIDLLVFFIAVSLLLYVLLGGSDYGAGIIELLPAGRLRDPQKEAINHAMGPVWEANHIWLILIVVILFMGFPLLFTTIMTTLHLPMLALLVGIVVRGTAFTFRHYDPVQEGRSQTVYTILFGFSSLWTAVWLGISVASLTRGFIDPDATSFHAAYIAPWWGIYPLTVGAFVSGIFVFLAAIYLIGETDRDDLRQRFVRLALGANIYLVLAGGLVALASYGEPDPLPAQFLRHPDALAAPALATLLLVALWWRIRSRSNVQIRIIAVSQVSLILLGWWLLYAPNAIHTTTGALSFYAEAAPTATQKQLLLALLIGSVAIFPALYFLLRVFKTEHNKPNET